MMLGELMINHGIKKEYYTDKVYKDCQYIITVFPLEKHDYFSSMLPRIHEPMLKSRFLNLNTLYSSVFTPCKIYDQNLV